MATTPIQPVRPGDLITAAFINEIIGALNSLQSQVEALGSGVGAGSAPVITGLEPAGDIEAGTILRIHGANFAVPAILNTVALDTTRLEDFLGGTDELLVVNVPGYLAGLPKTMLLKITTSSGSDSTEVRVVSPQLHLGGQVKVTNVTGPLGPITPGDTYTFEFKLDTAAFNAPEQFRIRADYTNAVGAAVSAWQASTSYMGTTGSDHNVTVAPETPKTVGVSITVPANAASVDLTVRAISVHNHPGSSNASPVIPITVGQAPPETDSSIQLGFGTNQKPTLHPQSYSGAISGEGLAIKYGANPIVTLTAAVEHGGSYQFAAQIEDETGTVWEVTQLPQTKQLTDNDTDQIQFRLRLIPASPPAESVSRYFRFLATRQDADSIGQISNYMRFPIGGFT